MFPAMDFSLFTVDQFTAHIRAFRKARGMTQADLGRLLGVKQARIADIENDPGSISVAQMHKLLAALGAQMVLRDKSGGWSVANKDVAATGDASKVRAAKAIGASTASPTLSRSGTRLRVKPAGDKPTVGKKRGGTW